MTDDPIFVMKSGAATYSPMDNEYLALIRNSSAGYYRFYARAILLDLGGVVLGINAAQVFALGRRGGCRS